MDAWPVECLPEATPRSHLAVPMFISDSIKPVASQLDGKTYSSRSELYAHYQSEGVRVLDAGESTTRPEIKKTTDADILPAARRAGLV